MQHNRIQSEATLHCALAGALALAMLFPATRQGTGGLPVPVDIPAEFERDLPFWKSSAISTVFGLRVGHNMGGREIKVAWEEKDPSSSTWFQNTTAVKLAFRVLDVAVTAGGNEIYAAGIQDDGDAVIVRLTFKPRDGGYQIRSTVSPVEPLGTSMPNHDSEFILTTGSFTAPTPSSYGTPARRVVIGNQLGLIRRIEVDPYGRYLLLLTHDDAKIHQLDFTAEPATLSELYTAADIPGLNEMWSLKMLGRNDGEHFCAMTNAAPFHIAQPPSPKRTMLYDADNDGTFTVHSFTGLDEASAGGFGTSNIELFWDVDLNVADW